MKIEWRTCLTLGALALVIGATACSDRDARTPGGRSYTAFSRFTDPGDLSSMYDPLPMDPTDIAAVAGGLTVHHNLLAYFEVPKDEWSGIPRVWPPKAPNILAALKDVGPDDLLADRTVTERVRSACMLESHFLASMLRYRDVPARLRAGYFRDVYTDEDHLVAFWEKNAREKGVAEQLLREDPDRWLEVNHDYTRKQVAVNKCVEHWVAEYWDEERRAWRLLDANTTFLKAMSGIDVGVDLPRRHFEYAFEAWRKMRTAGDFNPDQYAEWPQDGRSHIRSQLLWDFYSLLNHDIAGYDRTAWGREDSMTAERRTYAFVKEKTFDELSPQELDELDALADLLSRDPGTDALVAFYRASRTLRIPTVDDDPYSFIAASPRRD